MIPISKQEKEAILEEYPHTHVVRTMKQKSKRHRYYCEENKRVMNLLENLRSPEPAANNDRKDDRYSDRKNGE